MKRELHASFLGAVSYARGLELQLAAREALRRGEGPERLLLLEHPHVYTLGRNAGPADIVAPPEWLRARGIEVHECDRGGQITYHGPGQLVGYPIVDLNPDRRDVRRYVRDLEEVLIRTLSELGVGAGRRGGGSFTGVWLGERKIASIGVHISRWLTSHGFALNVTTDLSYFAGIVPCGLTGVTMVSIESLTGQRPAVAIVARIAARRFAEVFQRELVEPGAVVPAVAQPAAPEPAAPEPAAP